jgi:hypothetical protein
VDVRVLPVVDPFSMKLAEAIGSNEYPDLDAARVQQRGQARQLTENATSRLRAAGFSLAWSFRRAAPEPPFLTMPTLGAPT